ncbi:MAG: non-ribosomal peptide synthetase component F, partial [Rhodococcus sp. (in: high G+C Gram-positive bacteria)]
MMVNTLVLRTSVVGSARFVDVLSGVREVDLSAFAHADVPFERVVEVVNPPRVQGRHPLYQVMLTFRDVGSANLELGDLAVEPIDTGFATAKIDLDLAVSEARTEDNDPGGMAIDITYATDLFDA